jgi:hypothetical protein
VGKDEEGYTGTCHWGQLSLPSFATVHRETKKMVHGSPQSEFH